MRPGALAAIGLGFATAAAAAATGAVDGPAAPARIPWVWDGGRLPSPLPREIAPVVRQVWLHDDVMEVRPGAHEGAPPPGVRLTPVVHVELSWSHPPVDPARHAAALRELVLRAAASSTSGRVQLDLEARPSQREFQRALVHDVHEALQGRVALSVTALAWWCRAPGWLDGLEAEEIVPMFFRMGRDGPAIRRLLEDSPQALHPRCRSGAAGFSPREPLPDAVVARYGRAYWFDRHPR